MDQWSGNLCFRDSKQRTGTAGARLYTVSTGTGGGILVWDPADMAASPGVQPLVQAAALGLAPGLEVTTLGGRSVLLVSGQAGLAITGHWIAVDGSLSAGFRLAEGAGEFLTLETVESTSGPMLFSTSRVDPGVTCWNEAADGTMVQSDTFSLGDESSDADLTGLAQVQLGGLDYLLVTSGGTASLSSLRINADGSLAAQDNITALDGLQISGPTMLTTVQLDGRDYAIVAAAGSSSLTVVALAAGSSSLTVVALAADGRLGVTDQVIDDLTTRFQSVATLTTVTLGDQVFVLAGGGE